MTWWRHDSSLWSRSPIHRYAQRILRDNEAALRTRGFSRTLPKSAQHEEPTDKDDRPEGMSSLEWRQLQQYKRWRRRLNQDPYKALFGASEDMLSGKGLKDWDWVYKSFPKWMLNDADINQAAETTKTMKRDGQARDYGKRPTINQEPVMNSNNISNASTNSGTDTLLRRKPYFPEPCIRTTNFERDDFGIVSPSDLRRPRESSQIEVLDSATPLEPSLETKHNLSGTTLPNSTSSALSQYKEGSTIAPNQIENNSQQNLQILREDVTARESAFIDEFLAIKFQHPSTKSRNKENTTSWRQTALERRVSSAGSVSKKTLPAFEARSEQEVEQAWHAVPKNFATPPSDAAYKVSLLPEKSDENGLPLEHEKGKSIKYATTRNTEVRSTDRLILQETAVKEQEGKPLAYSKLLSTSEKLSMLPDDDVDFLSAAEIRASVAGKRASIKSDVGKLAKHEMLEKEFLNIHKRHRDIDPMIESKTINDRLVRRTERQLLQLQDNSKATEAELSRNSVVSEPYQVESSIDRMKRWLEEGSATISKHFWQDPIPEGASDFAASKAYLDKVIARIQKGRSATTHIVEDLERDIPACKQLLKRLKDDEEMLHHSTSVLRRHMMEASTQVPTPLKLKQVQTNSWKYERTELELLAANKLLSEIENVKDTSNVGELFRRRLRLAASVCHKNSKLTRSLIWSLQGRLDDNKIHSHVQAYYRVIAHRLLTLRDTQLALIQLVDRAMQVYKVTPKTLEEDLGAFASSRVPSDEKASHTSAESQSPHLNHVVASDVHLANEIQAQKSAMQGLSDDGYSRAPKSSSKKTFDEQDPLAHSLFRPFTQLLESLGKETNIDPEVERLKEDARKKLNESRLVDEVRKVYEDVYGPITVNHRQICDEIESGQISDNKEVTSFQLLNHNAINEATELDSGSSNLPLMSKSSSENELQEQQPEAPVSLEMQENQQLGTFAVSSDNTKTAEASGLSLTSEISSPDVTNEVSSSENVVNGFSLNQLPTQYTILILNAKTDTLTITTSTTPPPRDPSPTIPIHLALSALDSPAKFVPYLTSEFEIITAKRDMLVLRDSVADKVSISTTSTPASKDTEGRDAERSDTNPVDGTTRLSPTGYVGVEDTEQLEKEFQERRIAAGKMAEEQREERKNRKRSVGGVVKTAIWATAGCYVIGVLGEVFK